MFGRWTRRILALAIATAVTSAYSVRADEPKADEMKPVADKVEAKQDENKSDEKSAEEKKLEAEKRLKEAREAAIRAKKMRQAQNAGNKAGQPVRPTNNRNAIPEATVKLEPGQTPGVKFDTPVYDFGRVKGGTEVIHDFFFTNTGNGPLEILKVKPGCGCTKAGDHDKIVQPGETGKIPIRMNTNKGSGKVSKPVTIYTNCVGQDSTVRLQITGELWQPIDIAPRSAAFGRLTPDKVEENMTRKLTITSNIDDKITPGAVTSTSENFKAELKPIIEGKKYEVVVTLVPPIKKGNNTGTIRIESGLDEPKTIDVQAYAFLTSPIDVSPSELTLEDGRTAELTRKFYINNNDTNPLEITDLKCSSDKVKMEISDLRGNKKIYQLVVTIPADYTPPAQGDTISFKTNNPSMPDVTVPLKVKAAGPTPVRRIDSHAGHDH